MHILKKKTLTSFLFNSTTQPTNTLNCLIPLDFFNLCKYTTIPYSYPFPLSVKFFPALAIVISGIVSFKANTSLIVCCLASSLISGLNFTRTFFFVSLVSFFLFGIVHLVYYTNMNDLHLEINVFFLKKIK